MGTLRKTTNHKAPDFAMLKFINTFVFLFLTALCFYQYSGFQNIFYTYTQDYIPLYAGPRYIMSHPSFVFVMQAPHFAPLAYFSSFFMELITNGTEWLVVLIILFIHIINAFMIFKIALILNEERVFPSCIASALFIISAIYTDSLLSSPHCHAVVATSFGLLSLYLFLKVIYAGGNYRRDYLLYSFIFYFLSILVYDCFIGLIAIYFIIMSIRIKYFKKPLLCAVFIVFVYFISVFLTQNILIQKYGFIMPPSVSFNLIQNIKNYNYSFLQLTSLFFHNYSKALGSMFSPNVGDCINRYFTIFALCSPILFLKRERILKLYSVLLSMYLIFIPYLFSKVPLCARHITPMVTFTSLFVGVYINNIFSSIKVIKVKYLKGLLSVILVIFTLIFFSKYFTIVKREAKNYIVFNSANSHIMKKLIDDFKNIDIPNPKKQIYFLKNEIPREHAFLYNSERVCYVIFYFAAKYKELPIDLYLQVYKELECGVLDLSICENYYISLSDGSCFGLYRDRDKLLQLINENPGIKLSDVVVLNWQNGRLEHEIFD